MSSSPADFHQGLQAFESPALKAGYKTATLSTPSFQRSLAKPGGVHISTRGESPRFYSRGSPACRPSDKSTFGKTHDARPGHDEMVENLNVYEGQRRLERAGENLVGVARLGDPRGVVVGEDDGGGVRSQCGLHDFAGIDAGLRERSAEKLLDGDHAVLRVELQAHENLVRQARQLQLEQVAHGSGTRKAIPASQVLRDRPRGEFPRSLELHGWIGRVAP